MYSVLVLFVQKENVELDIPTLVIPAVDVQLEQWPSPRTPYSEVPVHQVIPAPKLFPAISSIIPLSIEPSIKVALSLASFDELYQDPFSLSRSLACTVDVDSHAIHVPPIPAELASDWQMASAVASPPIFDDVVEVLIRNWRGALMLYHSPPLQYLGFFRVGS